jgi:hypothetical protein
MLSQAGREIESVSDRRISMKGKLPALRAVGGVGERLVRNGCNLQKEIVKRSRNGMEKEETVK